MTLFALWSLALVADVFTIGVLAERQQAATRAYNLREERRLLSQPYVTVTDGGAADETVGRHAERPDHKGNRYQRRAEILRTETKELRIVPRREVKV